MHTTPSVPSELVPLVPRGDPRTTNDEEVRDNMTAQTATNRISALNVNISASRAFAQNFYMTWPHTYDITSAVRSYDTN